MKALGIDPEILRNIVPHTLLGQVPVLIFCLVTLVVAVVLWRHYPRPARMVFLAMLLLLLERLLFPFWIAFRITRDVMLDWEFEQGRMYAAIGGIVFSTIDVAALLLLVIAAFTARRAAPIAAHAPAAGRPHPPVTARPIAPASRGLFIGGIVASALAAWALVIPAVVLANTAQSDEQAMIAVGLSCGSLLPLIVGAILVLVLLHRLWSAIQGGTATRTTPGKAIGYLFIPLFNIYWVFQAYWGWAVDYNHYRAEFGFDGPRAPQGIALAVCILAVISITPVVGLVAGVINLVLLIIFLNGAINCLNAVAATATNSPQAP